MKIFDITRELLSTPAYPGDPQPALQPVERMALGDVCNLSSLSLCLHNATHLDTPLHFLPGGPDAASVSLDACLGECRVEAFDGVLLGDEAERMLARGVPERLLLKGRVDISPSAAFVLSSAGVRLLGVEPQTVSADDIVTVHRQLMSGGMLLLEGLDLSAVRPGTYFLLAMPLKISGAEGSPVRAVLLERHGGSPRPADQT